MNRYLGACLAATVLAASGPAPVAGTVTTKDGPRTYLLLRPDEKGPMPLVILLHGHGGSAKQALTAGPMAAWTAISARERVLVASLDGVKGPDGRPGWNDCRGDASGNPRTDDVFFVQAVIQKLERDSGADPRRVYLMGMSNGAMMALRLALQLDSAPAAFCAVCGLMADGGPCDPPVPRAVPALLMDGTEDPLVPYSGGQVHFFKKQRGAVIGADRTVAFWLAADGLADARPVVSEFPHREASDPTRAIKSVWGLDGGVQVEFIRIQGGGHAEPTLVHPYNALYRAFTGKQNQDLESAEEAWAFFKDKRSE